MTTDLLPLLGVLLCALGTVVNTSGMLCMKRASLLESSFPFYLRRFFWIGVACVVLNATAFDMIVYAVSPLSLIAPVSSLTVVWGNVFASRGWITGEREDVSVATVRANAVIVAGILLTTTFGPHGADLPSPEEMAERLQTAGARAFAACSLAAIGIAAVRLFGAGVKPPSAASSSATATVSAASSSLSNGSVERSLTVDKEDGEGAVVDSSAAFIFLFPLSSALCASLSVASFKAVAIYLARFLSSATRPRPLPGIGAAVALFVGIAFAVLNATFLNAGMERSKASYFVSTYQALLIVLTVVAGGAFYGEFDQLSGGEEWRAVGFGLGIGTAVGGIAWLSYLQPSQRDNSDGGGESPEYVEVELREVHDDDEDQKELLEGDVDDVSVTVTNASIV